ncbi:MAG: AI-2E family transporter, partial [Lachnospiraceae bacterium]
MKKYGPFAFAILAAGIVLYFLLFRGEVLGAALAKIGTVLTPIIYGFVIAYALNPQMRLIEKGILTLVKKTQKTPSRRGLVAIRIASTILAVLVLLAVIYSLIALMIPEIAKSIQNIVNNISVYAENIEKWISSFGGGESDPGFKETMDKIVAAVQKWINTQVTPEMDQIVKKVTASVLDILVFFKNIFLGLIVSIYVLITQETILARFRRATYAVFNVAVANRFLKNLRFVDEKFGGFLIGKCIDSLIIGIICYIGVRILQMPYALLIAVIIGITNIIPFFGPFIGAIPCAFLVFCVDPIKAIYFIIFVFALQQFDGNLLGPKI